MCKRSVLLVLAVAVSSFCLSSALHAQESKASDANAFFSLAGQAGLPRYMKCNSGSLADSVGLRGGEVRTLETDYINKDFVLDVVFQFKNAGERGLAFVGIGENGKEGGWTLNSVMVNLVGPARGNHAEVITHKNPKRPLLGKFPNPGPHVVRLEKKGNSLTTSIYANFDEKVGMGATPDFTRTMDLAKDAPYLTKLNSALFFGGEATFKAVRLTVDGKPVDAGMPANKGFKDVTGGGDLVKLIGGGKLPAFMEQPKTATVGRDGLSLSGLTVRTRQGNFLHKNFTFDVVYRFRPDDRTIMLVGMGANRRDSGNWFWESVGSRICSPNRGGHATVAFHSFADDAHFAELGKDHAGPNMFRMQKCGDTLTMALCLDFQGEFKPDYTATIPSLKYAAPTLDEKTCYLFVGEGGIVEQMRLVIEGETVDTTVVELDVPARFVAGEAVRKAIIKDAGTKRFSIQSGPAGMTLSPEGVLAWTASADQAGKHEVKIAIADKGRVMVQPVEIEVVPGAAPKPAVAPGDATPGVAGRQPSGEMRAAAAKLVGTWDATIVFDDAKLEAMLKQQKVPADKMAAAVAMLKKNLAVLKMALVFRADGTGESVVSGMGPAPEISGGKWEVTEASSIGVKVKLSDKAGKAQMMTLMPAGNDRFVATLSDDLAGPLENPVTFRRSAAAVSGAASASPAGAAAPAAASVVLADAFIAEFDRDDAAFKKLYNGKTLTIEGKVREAKAREEGGFTYVSIVLVGKNQPAGKGTIVIGNFPSAMAAEVKKIKPDSMVRFTGEFMSASKFMGEINLSTCSQLKSLP